jgi:hypothetical protein
MENTINIEAINRFVQLAARGAFPGAAGGEKICNRLAKALEKIGDDLALLDPDAIDGAHGLMRLMGGPWPTYESKETVFNMVHRAATGRKA